MTLIVAVLSPEYALAMADTHVVISGPGSANLGDGATHVIDQGYRMVVDGHPGLPKVMFNTALTDAVGSSGSRDAQATFLGLQVDLAGIEIDERIAEHLEPKSEFRSYHALPPGSYTTYSALHAYRAGHRFVATRISSGPGSFSRRCYRSNKKHLEWAAIGSGKAHAVSFMGRQEVRKEWAKLSTQLATSGIDQVLAFWGRVFAFVSTVDELVNSMVSAWVLGSESEQWQWRGHRVFDPDGGAELPHSFAACTWKIEREPDADVAG